MPKLLCTLPNASDEISGIKFVSHANGMLSEEVADDVAEMFATIPGYQVVGGVDRAAEAAAAAAAKAAEEAAEEAAKADLLKRAEAVSFKPKASWGLERLTAEVVAAEAAAAKAAADAEKKPADAEKAEGDK